MSQQTRLMPVRQALALLALAAAAVFAATPAIAQPPGDGSDRFDHAIRHNSHDLLQEGRRTFRHDTFGDEAFWGDTLGLHRAVAGASLGGVGPGVSPRTAL